MFENDEIIQWKFHSHMYGNDIEHMVIQQNKTTKEYTYLYHYINTHYEITYDMR